MMGRQVDQGALFYEVRLEERVPAGHLLRRVDAILDLSFVRVRMAPHYACGGRPSVDPELMVRMLLVGYLYGVRSERRLCEDVDLNLAFRWFCRLGLDGRVPDHSTFTKNRHGRFRDSDIMREVFERTVELCLDCGLADAALVAVDGTHVSASASSERHVKSADDLPREGATRAVRDYFEHLDTAAPDLAGTKRQTPAAISVTNPCSALSTKYGKRRFAYGLNAMIDTASGVVLEVEAAPARTADEPKAARRMVERMRDRRGFVPGALTADMGYGSTHFFAWAEKAGVQTFIPPTRSRASKRSLLPKSAFTYDLKADVYRCPEGKTLWRSGSKRSGGTATWNDGRTVSYHPSRKDCGPCRLRQRCAPAGLRSVHRSIDEPARERALASMETRPFRRAQALRLRVERLFAHIKHNDGLHRVRLRGLRGAAEQFALAAAARNLKLMAKRMIPGPADGSANPA